jgi:glycolate oxidase iron-sulfur subunit
MADAPDIHTRAAEGLSRWDKARYDETLHCNRCGFCTSYCPTYLATGDEGLSPRGRNQVFRALLEGRLADPAQAKRSVDTCLQCGICTSVCFAEVPTAKLMGAAKQKLMAAGGEPLLLRFLLRFLLPRPRLLEAVLKVLFLGKRLGVSRLLNRLGILRLVSPALAAAEEMSAEVPAYFLREQVAPAAADAEVAQFMACGPNYLLPSAGLATDRLVAESGCRHGRAENVCCGLPALSSGDLEAGRALARRNIEALEKYPKAVILVDDSSCAATIKDYPALFEEDPAWKPRAQAVAARAKDLSEWLVERGAPLPPRARAVKATYHDPCKARYAQKLVEPPRKLLAALAGVTFVELPEADQCCGGGGSYSFLQPEISRRVLARKSENIRSTGADVVLTSSVTCLLQLRFGLRRMGAPVKAEPLSEFLAPD